VSTEERILQGCFISISTTLSNSLAKMQQPFPSTNSRTQTINSMQGLGL
jgi:hypothetical protein